MGHLSEKGIDDETDSREDEEEAGCAA